MVWSSDRDLGIRLYVTIPYEFLCRIFQDRYWFMHIPFGRMEKFELVTQFPVDYLVHLVVSSLILILLLLSSPLEFFTSALADSLSLELE